MMRRVAHVIRGVGYTVCTPVSRAYGSVPTLPFNPAPYNGISVSSHSIPPDTPGSQLQEQLLESCATWAAQGKGSVWLPLRSDQGEWISAAARAGFVFHHAEGGSAMMHRWLPTSAEGASASRAPTCPVPPFATHHMGAGGVVVNERDEVLVVQEAHKNTGWKFPGGLADLAEDVADTAVREVFEETGVRTSFRSLIAIRHAHKLAWGRSDLFFLCRLHALSHDIQMDTHELAAARWMHVDEFLTTGTHALNRFAATVAVKEARAERAANVPAATALAAGGTASGGAGATRVVHVGTIQRTVWQSTFMKREVDVYHASPDVALE